MSTSTIGREERKPLLDAYMFERRMLLGCTVLIGVALIFWVVAISTDYWIIISGEGGIFIAGQNRFFLSSHSGLWRICRYSSIPVPRENMSVALNITSLSYQNATLVRQMKAEVSRQNYIQEFLQPNLTLPITTFDDNAKKQMFAHWVRNDTAEFRALKASFRELVLPDHSIVHRHRNVVKVDSSKPDLFRIVFYDRITNLTLNGTNFYYVIPMAVQRALFPKWHEHPRVPRLIFPYMKDLEIPLIVLNSNDEILQLVPPQPPRRGRFAHGFEYAPFQWCKYIDMFPTENAVVADPSVDTQVLDYLRTQASFACITAIIMAMGSVFSMYTFLNPRYMFKRLAGGIHFISAATTLVVIQVLVANVEYQQDHLSFSYPDGAVDKYGYGVFIAWFVFASNLFAGLMFMWYSKKKKGNKAPTDELAMADEPINIGR